VRLIFDCETDGLLDELTRVHCIVTADIETGELRSFHERPDFQPRHGGLKDGLAYLEQAELLAGHNAVGFDIPALQKLYPAFKPAAQILDTLVGVNAVWPVEHLSHLDYQRIARPGATFPQKMAGRHSLEAWGHRLKNHKGQKPESFETFTESMLLYCGQDVNLTRDLFLRLERRIREGKFTLKAWEIEQAFAREIEQQEKNGFKLDVKAADALTARLQARRAELKEEIARTFPPFEITSLTDPDVIARQEARVKTWEVRHAAAKTSAQVRKMAANLEKARAILAQKKLPRVKIQQFNPGSRDHIAKHLMERCDWKPSKLDGRTDPSTHHPDGKVKVTEDILGGLRKFAGIPLLIEYLTVAKVLGMLSEGKQAWTKKVAQDGRIHGKVRHNGAVTGRCTHSNPNMTQVPKVGNPWGAECRELFVPEEGRLLLGVDASGLELRMLAHYLARYDDGEYIRTVTEGDPHRKTQVDAGIPDGPTARDTAKRFKYAWLYGAGDRKLAKVLGCSVAHAKETRTRMLRTDRALARFKNVVTVKARAKGTIKMPDGRLVFTRSEHAALNTALQGAGAIVMKLAVVRMHEQFRAAGLDVRQVHQAHDEVQLEVLPEQAAQAQVIALASIPAAGVELGIRCPLAGDSKIGRNWKETH